MFAQHPNPIIIMAFGMGFCSIENANRFISSRSEFAFIHSIFFERRTIILYNSKKWPFHLKMTEKKSNNYVPKLSLANIQTLTKSTSMEIIPIHWSSNQYRGINPDFYRYLYFVIIHSMALRTIVKLLHFNKHFIQLRISSQQHNLWRFAAVQWSASISKALLHCSIKCRCADK